jgi:glycosyltransferase involved in cell wall biosynthesis
VAIAAGNEPVEDALRELGNDLELNEDLLEHTRVVSNELRQRLNEAWPYLLDGDLPAESDGDSVVLDKLVAAVHGQPDFSRLWLFIITVAGAFPTADDVRHLHRRFSTCDASEAYRVALEAMLPIATREAGNGRRMRIVSSMPVVDVDFCARFGHNTGIQRVVRETLSRWSQTRDFVMTAWTPLGTASRELTQDEEDLVLHWSSDKRSITPGDEFETELQALVVPWRTTVFLPEVPNARTTEPLAALAEFSGNRVAAIGYDSIPVVSSNLVPIDESNRFARYLTIAKHVDSMICISESAANEFRGYARAVAAQNVTRLNVVGLTLPVDTVSASPDGVRRGSRKLPMVLSVGSREYRKNQATLLVAAERLWREGLQFELLFLGGDSLELSDDFHRIVKEIGKKRPLTLMTNVSDEILLAAYNEARFSVFISLHEGYGLPVAESLAHGTPVLATDYGSIGEIAAGGGCVVVDPRDDDAVRDALRELLTNDALVAQLRDQIATRPHRSWQNYADELWRLAIEGQR